MHDKKSDALPSEPMIKRSKLCWSEGRRDNPSAIESLCHYLKTIVALLINHMIRFRCLETP